MVGLCFVSVLFSLLFYAFVSFWDVAGRVGGGGVFVWGFVLFGDFLWRGGGMLLSLGFSWGGEVEMFCFVSFLDVVVVV